MSESESSLPVGSRFWSCWKRRKASADSSPHTPVGAACRYPRSNSACWISRCRSGVGTCWPCRQLGVRFLREADFLPRLEDFFEATGFLGDARFDFDEAVVFAGGVVFPLLAGLPSANTDPASHKRRTNRADLRKP